MTVVPSAYSILVGDLGPEVSVPVLASVSASRVTLSSEGNGRGPKDSILAVSRPRGQRVSLNLSLCLLVAFYALKAIVAALSNDLSPHPQPAVTEAVLLSASCQASCYHPLFKPLALAPGVVPGDWSQESDDRGPKFT